MQCFTESLLTVKGQLSEWVHLRAAEGTIDAILSEDQCSLRVTCTCVWKTPLYTLVIRRQVADCVSGYHDFVCDTTRRGLKVSAASCGTLTDRGLAFSVPPTAGTRWLHLLKGTMMELSNPEFMERYAVNIQAMERALPQCVGREDFKKLLVECLVLHHRIIQKLGADSLGDMCFDQSPRRIAENASAKAAADAATAGPGQPQPEVTMPVHQPAVGTSGQSADGNAAHATTAANCSKLRLLPNTVTPGPAPCPPDPATDPSSSGRRSVAPARRTLDLNSASIGTAGVPSPGKLDLGCERSRDCMAEGCSRMCNAFLRTSSSHCLSNAAVPHL